MSATETAARRNNPVSLADEEGVKRVLVNSVLGLWEVVNNLTRLQPSRRERYRVTIFGSARAGTFAYEETKRVATALAELGCDIVTGGGPGLMQAANEGTESAGEQGKSLGIRVDLPFEQAVNPFVELAFEHRTFFTRLHHFVLASDAFVVALADFKSDIWGDVGEPNELTFSDRKMWARIRKKGTMMWGRLFG